MLPTPPTPAAAADPAPTPVRAVRHALISVSDKTGLAALARGLVAAGVELVSTGGSARCLADAGLPVTDVAAYTGFPEMMGGRLKTLHPLVHGGVLCRRDDPQDTAAAARHGIRLFDLVVVNLYPFRETVADPAATTDEAIEKIDIGGPALLRSAAKNHAFVAVACSPTQYEELLAQVESTGGTTPALRARLAAAAFACTAEYEAAIAGYFAPDEPPARDSAAAVQSAAAPSTVGAPPPAESLREAPRRIALDLSLHAPLRYGENPHQSAGVYLAGAPAAGTLAGAEQLSGKELSYNNLLDLDAALACVRSLPAPAVVVVKHNNPCGAATARTADGATQLAWEGDPTSAFGSILGFNVPVDASSARRLTEPGKFVEAIIAPAFSPEALELLTTRPKWRRSVRLLRVGTPTAAVGGVQLRQIDGGFLAQQADDLPVIEAEWRCATENRPDDDAVADLRFAWAVCRHVRSNAIVLVRGGAVVGVGAGQMSRVDSVEIALRKAGDRAAGAVLASDAFFPFDDAIGRVADAGVEAVIQPGGSRRDSEVVAACDRHRLAMLLTARRHFRH